MREISFMEATREVLAAAMEAECGAELRSLQALFATLRSVAADDRACPLRPGIIAEPLIKALLLPGDKVVVRDLMVEAVSANLGTALKDGYAQVVQACTTARVRAAPLVVRTNSTTTTGSPASTLSGGADSQRHQTGQGTLNMGGGDNGSSRATGAGFVSGVLPDFMSASSFLAAAFCVSSSLLEISSTIFLALSSPRS